MSQIIPEGRRVALFPGDCLESLRKMPDNSVDSIVTDPPYGLSFMGKKWDYDVPSVEIWAECMRVLKPGGHLLAFAGTRTQHRMAVRIEDAGFEIRDMIAWVYGSGFPKSLDVSKAIDKATGADREVVGTNPNHRPVSGVAYDGVYQGGNTGAATITAPATEAARLWQGWGTALKPALEPITVARKPLTGTVAENVLAHGTGALNIDGCRVGTETVGWGGARGGSDDPTQSKGRNYRLGEGKARPVEGRWPANLIHSGEDGVTDLLGSAARFFYCAKASKRDRDEGLEGFAAKDSTVQNASGRRFNPVCDNTGKRIQVCGCGACEWSKATNPKRANTHPTVKPTDLMRYLCRLVTPPGGVVLDPFMGSGSTGKAAMLEGFRFIGCELSPEYLEIAKARIRHAMQQSEQASPANDNAEPGRKAATA